MKFCTPKVAQVTADDMTGVAGDRQFDQVVVALVGQIGAPSKVDRCPAAGGEKDIQKFFALPDIQSGLAEHYVASQHILVFRQQRRTHEGRMETPNAVADDSAGCAHAQTCAYEYVRVDDDHHVVYGSTGATMLSM